MSTRMGGDCFTAALKVANDLWGSGGMPALLVHGRPVNRGPVAGERYWHAWVEAPWNDQWLALDYSNGLEVVCVRAEYYALGQLDEEHVIRYPEIAVRERVLATNTCGPWITPTLLARRNAAERRPA